MSAESRAFLDTNIWLYAFIVGQDRDKHREAHVLMQRITPVVSTQVINEVCVNLLRKAAMDNAQIEALIHAFYESYEVYAFDCATLTTAATLWPRYSLSFWDSLIVASARAAGVTRLYSEDMQHGLVIEGALHILNPFLPDGTSTNPASDPET